MLAFFAVARTNSSNASALKGQTYRNYDYSVIENQPNKAAHDPLYQRFMESASNYDAFLKLDADMVLANERALEQLCDQVESDTSILFAWVNDIPSSLKVPPGITWSVIRRSAVDQRSAYH